MNKRLLLLAALAAGQASADDQLDVRLRAQFEDRGANQAAVVRAGEAWRGTETAEARFQWDAFERNALRGVASLRRSDGQARGTLHELSLERPLGSGFLSAGKKVMSWDVGYAFRPLDVVQQEDRRALYAPTLDGVPMLAWEWFDENHALTLVWSNPAQGRAGQPRGDESLAMRLYRRNGSRDEYAVLRLSARNGIEAGFSFSDVLNESMEVHASALLRQRQTQWTGADGSTLLTRDPGHWTERSGGARALAGFTYTTEGKLSLMGEAWYDHGAYATAQWDAWRARNRALQENRGAPAQLVAANLGWNASLLQGNGLRRQNVFARLAQNWGDVDLAGDVLWHPEDGGRISSATLSWTPAPWSMSASLRHFGGAANAVVRSLPLRWQAVFALSRAF